MSTQWERAWVRVVIAAIALGVMPPGWAATIQLRDKTTVTGEVLQVEDDRVILSLPRSVVSSVDGTPLPSPLAVGMPAPEFSAMDLTGTPRRVGKGQGSATVLHFWVQWCPHCRSDAPHIQALYDAYREDPRVSVLTVNLDRRRSEAEAFIQQHRITYPVISAVEQASATPPVDLTTLYQISGFPMTYVIDAQGIIRHKFSGSFSESGKDLGALVATLITPPAKGTSRSPRGS